MTGGEARRFARLVEAEVRPAERGLPAVRATDAVAAFDRCLRAGPRLNAVGLRVLLRLHGRLGPATDDLLRRLALHCYYGDRRVMAALGYDADAVVARAAAVRIARGRP